MASTYIYECHTAVTIKVPADVKVNDSYNMQDRDDSAYVEDIRNALFGPHAIILHTGGHVWIAACHQLENVFEGTQRVGTGFDNGYDQVGNCVLAVPAAWCEYHDEQDADSIAAAMEADRDLLGYARG